MFCFFVFDRRVTEFCASMYTSFHRTEKISTLLCDPTWKRRLSDPAMHLQAVWGLCACKNLPEGTDILPFAGRRVAKIIWQRLDSVIPGISWCCFGWKVVSCPAIYFFLLDSNDIQVEIQIVDFLSSAHVVQYLKQFSQSNDVSCAKPGIQKCLATGNTHTTVPVFPIWSEVLMRNFSVKCVIPQCALNVLLHEIDTLQRCLVWWGDSLVPN